MTYKKPEYTKAIALFTIVFFILFAFGTLWLSLSPSKAVVIASWYAIAASVGLLTLGLPGQNE